MSNSSTSRYESENRRYQRTAQTMISGSKCRHLTRAGLGLGMEYSAAYQTRSFSFRNTAKRYHIRPLNSCTASIIATTFSTGVWACRL